MHQGGKEQPVLTLHQRFVELEQRRRPDERPQFRNPVRANPERRQSEHEAIDRRQIRCTLSGAVTDKQLMPEQQRLGADSSHTPWAQQRRAGDQHVDGQDEEFTHRQNAIMHAIPCKTARRKRIPSNYEFATHRRRGFAVSNKSTRTVLACFALIAACGCGGGGGYGGGGGGPIFVSVNADPGGIWTGTDSLTPALTLAVVITEAGQVRGIRSDGAQYVGTVTTSGNNISGSFNGYLPAGSTFADGSNHGTGSISGTISAGHSITATVTFTTANNSTESGALNGTFDSLYNTGSSLASISGNYTNPQTGATVSVTSAGVITSQEATTGCVINGTVSIIDARYDVYNVSYSFASCLGAYAFLNGTTATGLGVLNTTVNPVHALIGVSNAGAGYILTLGLNKQ